MRAKQTIAVVDYGMGNLRSVEKAFERQGARVVVTSKARIIRQADKIVLPGVGAFAAAMQELEKRQLVDILKSQIQIGKPYLGICLGLQILFERSQEKDKAGRFPKGLGVLKGTVKKFRIKLKVPHMGWNRVNVLKKNCPLFKGIKNETFFYFVHSYYAAPESKKDILSSTDYGVSFCSSVGRDNIFATQFHPEKSQDTGLRLISNFINI